MDAGSSGAWASTSLWVPQEPPRRKWSGQRGAPGPPLGPAAPARAWVSPALGWERVESAERPLSRPPTSGIQQSLFRQGQGVGMAEHCCSVNPHLQGPGTSGNRLQLAGSPDHSPHQVCSPPSKPAPDARSLPPGRRPRLPRPRRRPAARQPGLVWRWAGGCFSGSRMASCSEAEAPGAARGPVSSYSGPSKHEARSWCSHSSRLPLPGAPYESFLPEGAGITGT